MVLGTHRETYLCDVITIHRPSARTRDSASHNSLLATGSIPVVGSSRNTTGGSPTSDMAVLSLRLFPPLERESYDALINRWKIYCTHHIPALGCGVCFHVCSIIVLSTLLLVGYSELTLSLPRLI